MQDIIQSMRRKTVRYIADNADSVEKDDMTLREELMDAAGCESRFARIHCIRDISCGY